MRGEDRRASGRSSVAGINQTSVHGSHQPAHVRQSAGDGVDRGRAGGAGMRLSVILPTIGRAGLEPALQSITSQWLPGDEVLVVGAMPSIQAMAEKYHCRFIQCPPGKDWGHSERNMASPMAHGD